MGSGDSEGSLTPQPEPPHPSGASGGAGGEGVPGTDSLVGEASEAAR